MKNISKLMVGIVFCAAWAFAQQQAPPTPVTVTSVFDRQISGVEREIVPAAEAMPESKFNFAPTQGEFKGVRTFGEQIRHVATTNFQIAAAILGEKQPVPNGENDNGDAKYKTKAEIVQYLKDSFAYVHKAWATINDKNLVDPIQSPYGPNKVTRLGMAVMNQGHVFNHYGQMVEYLRMNGIIPPASRQ